MVYTKKVALICVTRNNAVKLQTTLNSILQNTRSDLFDLYIVDNCSTDETIKLYPCRLPENITVIRSSKNLDWVGGINLGINLTKDYEYVGFLNDDIEVCPNWLENFIDVFNCNIDVGAVGPLTSNSRDWQGYDNARSTFPDWNLPPLNEIPRNNVQAMSVEAQKNWGAYRVGGMLAFFCVLFRRTAIDEVGLLDEAFKTIYLGDDDDYCRRLHAAGYALAISTKTYVAHYSGTSSSKISELDKRKELAWQIIASKDYEQNYKSRFKKTTPKILYLTPGNHVDYQNDCLLIGLKEVFGESVVDFNKQLHIYESFPEDNAKNLYGMGMTVTRVVPDLNTDRNDIDSKIKSQFFDYIVFGSIWRYHENFFRILDCYPKDRVVVVDGEDSPQLSNAYDFGVKYFKRELIYKKKNLLPISFAIPTRKLQFGNVKSRTFAHCDPRDRSTYIYTSEKDYYLGYAESKFAYTVKKSGWDCLRHYEILANGCIPIFPEIEKCPKLTMHNFPKNLCESLNDDLKSGDPDTLFEEYCELFQNHSKNYLTTEKLASYFIDAIR